MNDRVFCGKGVLAIPPATRPGSAPAKIFAGSRRPRRHSCWNHLIVAPLWPNYGVNLGTLLRTCDAAGACLAVPHLPWVPKVVGTGDSLNVAVAGSVIAAKGLRNGEALALRWIASTWTPHAEGRGHARPYR